MAIELHVLAGPRLLESFRLSRGAHLLGSSNAADLLLSRRDVPADVCRVHQESEGQVTLRALDETELRRFDGQSALQLVLNNGDFAEIAGLRLLALDRAPVSDVHFEAAPFIPPTAPRPGIRPPSHEALALRVRSEREVRVVPVDQVTMVFGRGPGNALSFGTPEVSRHHARLFHKPEGPWIEDLGSTHGTYLDGVAVTAAAWRIGAQVRLSRALEAPTLELLSLEEALAESDGSEAVRAIKGLGDQMQIIRRRVQRYGPGDQTVLILGETGTGKEVVAEALARLRGPKRPFQSVNCGALPETMVESTLFGHRKGSFTGASEDRVGVLEAAGDGTLFLDEIGDMPLAQQVKLLRVLETRQIQRVGETMLRPMAARLVVATHRDLAAMVKAGTFREDLYHRIAVTDIKLPPLRRRLEDIPQLTRMFLKARTGQSAGRTLSDAALAKLRDHHWPGNIRELRNVVERAALESDDLEIGPEAIEFRGATEAPDVNGEPRPAPNIDNLPTYLDGIARDCCERALTEAGGKIAPAARSLGMSDSAFRRTVKRLGIEVKLEAVEG